VSASSTTSSFQIHLTKAGKQFSRNWIFRNLSLDISSPQKLAVLGANGSGKSTLLQVLAGYVSLSEGEILFSSRDNNIPAEEVFSKISIATPYLELIEEFTLREIVEFHFKFKKKVDNISAEKIIELAQLEKSKDKVFKYFSSGMKQRAKLSLAILSEAELVLLDEPLSNLDKEGELWYRNMVERFLKNKMVIVCSNHHPDEYNFCERTINMNEI
jgi:ABC-type multidrug transport system ATPase subunit